MAGRVALLTSFFFAWFLPGTALAEKPHPAATKNGPVVVSRVETRSHEELARHNFDQSVLPAFLTRLEQALHETFSIDTTPRTLQVQVTLNPRTAALWEWTASPVLPSSIEQRLAAALHDTGPPKTRVTPFCLRFGVHVSGGNTSSNPPEPKLLSPHEKRLTALQRATLLQKRQIIQDFVRSEALPLWPLLLNNAKPDAVGLTRLARRVRATDSQKVSAAVLLDHDPSYYRALIEIPPGEPLVSAIHILWPLARGEFDLAWMYFKPVFFFTRRGSLAHAYLDDLFSYLRLFLDSLERQLRVAMELHDQTHFDEAIAIYDGILREYPCCSLAHYERWFSRFSRTKHQDGSEKQLEPLFVEWMETRKQVFGCHPLFALDAVTNTKPDQKKMLRRLHLRDLWTEPSNQDRQKEDYLRMGEIALDVGEWAIAAHVYFLASAILTPEEFAERKILSHFLFALEQLGVTELKLLFKGQHALDFAAIEAQIAARLSEAERKERKTAKPQSN